MIGGSAGHCSNWALDVDKGDGDGVLQPHYIVTLSTPDEEVEHRQRLKKEREEAIARQKLESRLAEIIDVMRKFPEGETATTIGSHVGASGMTSTKLTPYLAKLEERGAVFQCKIPKPGRGNKPNYKDGWRLTAEREVLPFMAST